MRRAGLECRRRYFYPRSPCGERQAHPRNGGCQRNFYPRSPCGERPDVLPSVEVKPYFYPRSPCGERLSAQRSACGIALFLSTLSLRRATRAKGPSKARYIFLSTLSLRRATTTRHISPLTQSHFYPRSPCGERPGVWRDMTLEIKISIHALLAESDSSKDDTFAFVLIISIHALLAESDLSGSPRRTGRQRFLSTLSLRRATYI